MNNEQHNIGPVAELVDAVVASHEIRTTRCGEITGTLREGRAGSSPAGSISDACHHGTAGVTSGEGPCLSPHAHSRARVANGSGAEATPHASPLLQSFDRRKRPNVHVSGEVAAWMASLEADAPTQTERAA